MGRKTFESFPKPLPDRTHVIITRDKNYAADFENCLIVHTMEEALAVIPKNEDAFNIGGGEIFRLGMPFSDKIELTKVHATFDADAFFPQIDKTAWHLENEEFHPKDEKHQFSFTYQTFIRK
jgi:dihydrofolate reductase